MKTTKTTSLKTLAGLALTIGLTFASTGCAGLGPVPDEPTHRAHTLRIPPITRIEHPFLGKSIAIVPFVNRSLSAYPTLGDSAPDLMAEMALEGGWNLVEGNQAQLDAVLEELRFGHTEAVKPGSAAAIGSMLGARYVMLGSVTDFRKTAATASEGFDIGGLVSVGEGKGKLVYECQVSGRIVDVETRRVIAARTESLREEIEVEGAGVRVLFVSVDKSESVETEEGAAGKVLKAAFANMVNELHDQVNARAAALRQPTAPEPPPSGPLAQAPQG